MKKKALIFLGALITIPVFLIAFIGAVYSPSIKIPSGYQGKHIDIKGRAIRYYQEGQGQDIFLLHGAMGSIEDWEMFYPLLKDKYRVTAIDRPGMGFSSIRDGDASIEKNAEITFEVIRELDLKDVIVVGHSYGGAIALKMAAQFNKNIKGYLLIAPLAYPDKKYDNKGILKLLTLPYFGEGAAVLLGPLIGDRMIEETLTRMIHTNRHKYPENFVPFRQRLWNKAISTTTKVRQSENYSRELEEMTLHYSTIKHRIYLIVGDKDSEDLQMQSQKLSEDIPNIKYLKLSGVNHYVQYDAPEEIVNFLFRLINET